MENCLDLAIRTEGAVGNVAPTIDKNAACCILGIHAEYVLGCYVLRGNVCFLQGDSIARPFFVHCVRIVSEQRLIRAALFVFFPQLYVG